ASSSCALEPVYLDLDALEDFQALGGEASLPGEEREALERDRSAPRVDFEQVRRVKRRAVERAFARFRDQGLRSNSQRAQGFRRFQKEHAAWLDDWALYRALHDRRQKSWRDWEPPLRDRHPAALDDA